MLICDHPPLAGFGGTIVLCRWNRSAGSTHSSTGTAQISTVLLRGSSALRLRLRQLNSLRRESTVWMKQQDIMMHKDTTANAVRITLRARRNCALCTALHSCSLLACFHGQSCMFVKDVCSVVWESLSCWNRLLFLADKVENTPFYFTLPHTGSPWCPAYAITQTITPNRIR